MFAFFLVNEKVQTLYKTNFKGYASGYPDFI